MNNSILRAVTGIVIAALINLSLAPLAQAAQHQRRPAASLGNPDTLQTYAEQLQAQWAQLRAQWQAAGVAPAIIERQQALQDQFEARHQQFMLLYRAAQAPAAGAAERQALADFLGKEQPKPTHLPINLDNMPWQVQKPIKTEPANTEAQLQQKLRLPTAPKAGTPQNAKAAPDERLTLKSATAATPADLAATLDAPQTAEIKALAASLNNNPHRIYQWVHDTIHYQPTQGSVQGAQNTLDKKAGNAVDTASLLIALLRSAGIPARYLYGTIELPVENAQNWVGGAKTADAAQQILSQGGVPNTILTKAGKDFAFRMEHVWVEALIQ